MTKLISLSDDAYAFLSIEKLSDESFSKVVKRLTSKTKGSLLDFAGKWPGGSSEAFRKESLYASSSFFFLCKMQ